VKLEPGVRWSEGWRTEVWNFLIYCGCLVGVVERFDRVASRCPVGADQRAPCACGLIQGGGRSLKLKSSAPM
jgi:hypothetical protein